MARKFILIGNNMHVNADNVEWVKISTKSCVDPEDKSVSYIPKIYIQCLSGSKFIVDETCLLGDTIEEKYRSLLAELRMG